MPWHGMLYQADGTLFGEIVDMIRYNQLRVPYNKAVWLH